MKDCWLTTHTYTHTHTHTHIYIYIYIFSKAGCVNHTISDGRSEQDKLSLRLGNSTYVIYTKICTSFV